MRIGIIYGGTTVKRSDRRLLMVVAALAFVTASILWVAPARHGHEATDAASSVQVGR